MSPPASRGSSNPQQQGRSAFTRQRRGEAWRAVLHLPQRVAATVVFWLFHVLTKILRPPLSWFYKDGKPTRLGRLGNNGLIARVFSAGIRPGMVVALKVRGRHTGEQRSTALVMAELNGERYLVSMLGQTAEWVRNVRAAGGLAEIHHGRVEQVLLEEVPIAERAPVLQAYLQRASGARPHIEVDYRASLTDFEKAAASYPTFHVLPRATVPHRADSHRTGMSTPEWAHHHPLRERAPHRLDNPPDIDAAESRRAQPARRRTPAQVRCSIFTTLGRSRTG